MKPAVPRSAFTLFEVMISLLVLTIAILATVALLPVGLKAQQLARSQTFAATTAMTLINNFHTPVDKFEGVSRLAPRYDGIPGTDPISTSSAPFQGWAGAIMEQEVHASPYQPNLEQQMGWLGGVMAVPTEIARRLDSDHDEIQRVIDQGGVLLYADPSFMMGLNQGAASDKTIQIAPSPELQKLVFAVTSLPQQNALTSNPAKSLPEYEVYPFPPEWISMQSFGRETRRLVGLGGGEGGFNPVCAGDYFFPNPWVGWPKWWDMNWQTGGSDPGFDNWWTSPQPSSTKRSGVAVSGNPSWNWYISNGILGHGDGGHGRYEPVRFSRPFRQGQEQDAYFPGNPIDDPDWNGDYVNPQFLNAPGTQYFGNGHSHGRNWRFFANKLGGKWMDGTAAAGSRAAWIAFQKLSGGNDDIAPGPKVRDARTAYDPASPVVAPLNPGATYIDPLDGTQNAFFRSGWLPVRAMITNPDAPSFQGLQNMDWNELAKTGWMPPTLIGPQAPKPGIAFDYVSGNTLKNFTWKSRAPNTVSLPATYEMRANYRDRAIDLWQAVMPKFSGAVTLSKNLSALVKDDEGGTLVDCNKYEFGPSELDQFKFIRPDELDPRDLPIHPAQVMALSYLAHAAMMVTGYAPPFGNRLQWESDDGMTDVTKVSWECLNWTYMKTPAESNAEVSLWATQRLAAPRASGTLPPLGLPAGQVAGIAPNPNFAPWDGSGKNDWEYPFFWQTAWSGANWDNSYVQQYPISQPVVGQGITKDALVVASDCPYGPLPPPAPASTNLNNIVELTNDTDHGWMVYPGDQLVFQISYYQWWYKWGKPAIPAAPSPNWPFGGTNMWYGNQPGDALPQFDGRYDFNSSPLIYPNLTYQMQTFRVIDVLDDVSEASLGPKPGQISGLGAKLKVKLWPPIPQYPIQFNDARGSVPQIDLDPIAFHKNTLVRRIAGQSDMVFARKAYEMAMMWAAAYAAESPNDAGAPRPANRQIMTDKPLALFDLFYDAGASAGDGNAVRVPLNPPTQNGNAGQLTARRTESFYRWMVPTNPVPNDWFPAATPPPSLQAMTNVGPGRERESFFNAMAYNDQLKEPSVGSDAKRFWLTKTFAAFHRARELTFWSVDWKSYEDAEIVPSAPVDFTKHDRYLRYDPVAKDYDVIAPWIEYGHSPLCGNPESLYVWTSPDREKRYVDVAGGDSAGYLYQNWIGGPDQQRSGTHISLDPTTDPGLWPNATSVSMPAGADPPATNGQPVSADVQLGHWGADRNGNGVLDLGPVPQGSRMRAVHVADFVYYDPVLRVHYGN